MKHVKVGNTLLAIVCFTFLFISGCGTKSNDTSQPGHSGDPDEADETDFRTEDIDERLLTANNRFAFRLYEQMLNKDEGKNVFISPLSVSTALSMTYNGAAEETKDAMAHALDVQGLSLEEVNRSNAALKSVIEHADPDVELSIANSLWGREGVPFKPDFLEQNEQFYDARVTELDFDDPQASVTINEWVRDQTKGKIEKIINDKIDPETILFLVNAICFKGNWSDPFDKANTTDEDFHLSDGTAKTVPMMSQSGEYAYYKGEGFETVQLPYGNGWLSMNIFLPDESSSLEQFHRQLNAQNWQKWMASFDTMTGNIQLPRFKLEYEKKLNDALKALGMEVAFDERRANFERMVDIPSGAHIQEVKHKSFIEVNEEGTEASASTSVQMNTESAPVESFNLRIDRPFFFTIQEKETGTLLFMGSVVEPE